ncbi:hypothetical protein D9M69_511120 [compost metagenome]
MRGAGSVDAPARGPSVEGGAGGVVRRHDQVDLAVGVRVVRAGQVLHVDHVDREAVQRVLGLEDAAVPDAAAFALAQPALGDAADAGLTQLRKAGAAGAVGGVEPLVERAVERLAGDLGGQAGDQLVKCRLAGGGRGGVGHRGPRAVN